MYFAQDQSVEDKVFQQLTNHGTKSILPTLIRVTYSSQTNLYFGRLTLCWVGHGERLALICPCPLEFLAIVDRTG